MASSAIKPRARERRPSQKHMTRDAMQRMTAVIARLFSCQLPEDFPTAPVGRAGRRFAEKSGQSEVCGWTGYVRFQFAPGHTPRRFAPGLLGEALSNVPDSAH